MSCPYLTEVTMVFCEASPVKKLIPSDRVSTASLCEAEGYTACPLYREALARHGRILEEMDREEQEKPAEPPDKA
jgi:hypothetical protein